MLICNDRFWRFNAKENEFLLGCAPPLSPEIKSWLCPCGPSFSWKRWWPIALMFHYNLHIKMFLLHFFHLKRFTLSTVCWPQLFNQIFGWGSTFKFPLSMALVRRLKVWNYLLMINEQYICVKMWCTWSYTFEFSASLFVVYWQCRAVLVLCISSYIQCCICKLAIIFFCFYGALMFFSVLKGLCFCPLNICKFINQFSERGIFTILFRSTTKGSIYVIKVYHRISMYRKTGWSCTLEITAYKKHYFKKWFTSSAWSFFSFQKRDEL